MKNIENIDSIAQEILNSCGGKTFLHIGSGCGRLVQILLSYGVEAYGIDESFESVKMANSLMPGRFLQGNIKRLPYANKIFDTTIVLYNFESLKSKELSQIVKKIKYVTRRSVYLRVKTFNSQEDSVNKNTIKRSEWECLFFNENFRKHPSYYLVNSYNSLSCEHGESVILLECISHIASELYPIQVLQKARDLHMDMTRETGERSDAHIARYQWATTFIRPGDTVLDAACGLGYGSYILQCNTMAARTIGIDCSYYAINYANSNFALDVHNLTFSVGVLPESLNSIPDNSIDVVVSFETLEHISDIEGTLKEFYRILTPAGRAIFSVPNDWSDETGKDPNPFHLHVYTLDKLRKQIQMFFDLENITVQSATRYKESINSKNWIPAKRELYEVNTNIDETIAPKSEWWLAIGMKSPLNTGKTVYVEKQYKTFPHPEWNVTAFSRDYKNPWLIRGMVDVGWRQKNKAILKEMVEKVIAINHDNSADTGAALCVKGYQLLEEKQTTSFDIINSYVRQVNQYVSSKADNPHVIRWMVSLHFVVAKLWLQAGMHNNAHIAFTQCVKIDPLQFSPLLANRIVEAYLYLGKLALGRGDKIAAREAWIAGIEAAQRAVLTDWKLSLGNLHSPAEFALPELSSILDYASNCAYALINIDTFQDKPWWWLQLQRSPHAQYLSQKIQLNFLRTKVSSLNTLITSMRDIIKEQQKQLSIKENSLQIKIKELAELTESFHEKYIVMGKQIIRFCNFNTIVKARLIRLRSVLLYQSWGANKIAHVFYLIVSLFIPQVIRNKLHPVTKWLRNYFFSFTFVKPINSALQLNKYHVKKPVIRQKARKVVHIIANFMLGGSSRLIIDLIEHLGHNYQQFILTSYSPKPPVYIGLDIKEQPNNHSMLPFIDYLKQKKPDFIHVHYWGDVDKNWYIKAIEAAQFLDIPVIENINTPVEPYISDSVKRYVYVSNYVRNVFGRLDEKHVTIYPGADFTRFMRMDDEIVPSNCVGMVYRLEYDKLNENSIKPFILIAQKRPKTKILIIGGGSLLVPFKKRVLNAGLEKQFEFTGYVDYEILPNYYRRMSLFIAPVFRESFGQVSSFAMNMRVPVIGYDVGAISEIVNSKEMLAASNDAESLSDIAIKLLNNDELREKIGREHQQYAKKNFSMQNMIKSYSKIYSEITEK